MTDELDFFTPDERRLSREFIEQGYVIIDTENRPALSRIQTRAAELAAAHLGENAPDDPTAYLDTIHERVTVDELNALRLHVIQGLNSEPWIRPAYFSLARKALETLVGNELSMQRRVNLSIQMPQDDSSLLPVHADVWDGDSPYEVVVWTPLVDCYATKAMYLVGPKEDQKIRSAFPNFADQSAEDIYQAIRDDARFIDIKFGQVLVFSQTLMHGNRINEEQHTRWSMNVRFKSALSPYADKRLGEFFEPITIRAATTVGMNYQFIEGFDDE